MEHLAGIERFPRPTFVIFQREMGNRGRLQGNNSKSVRDRLRDETAELHAAVDARFGPLIGEPSAAILR